MAYQSARINSHGATISSARVSLEEELLIGGLSLVGGLGPVGFRLYQSVIL
jgi:hypothetical protein